MKTIALKSIAILVMLTLCVSGAYAESKNTARYVKANEAKYLNKNVSLDVSHVTPMKAPVIEGIKLFIAQTYDKEGRSFGGSIVIATTVERAERFQKSYGLTTSFLRGGRGGGVATDLLRGKLRKFSSGILYVPENEEAATLVAKAPTAKQAITKAVTSKKPAGNKIRNFFKKMRRR